MSTFSDSLRLELIVTGDEAGNWGDITNNNLGTLLEQSIAGVASIAHDNTNTFTLSASNGVQDEARNMVLVITGTLTAQRPVIIPAATKVYMVYNSTTGGFGLEVRTSGGSGVVVPAGETMVIYCDATDVFSGQSGYFTGDVSAAGQYYYGDGKEIIDFGDAWLRLNQNGDFTSGIYTPGNLRVAGQLLVDATNGLTNVTGSYGTVQTVGTTSGYGGVNVAAHTVFMSNGTNAGIYNDTNNQWIIRGAHGGDAALYYAGVAKFSTQSDGTRTTGDHYVTQDLHIDHDVYIGANGLGDSWSRYYDDNSNDWRLFGWDDSANAFYAEENDGGVHMMAMVDTQSSTGATNFPKGHMIVASYGTIADRNGSRGVYLFASNNDQYVDSTQGSPSTQLSGTWRASGIAGGSTALYRRVA